MLLINVTNSVLLLSVWFFFPFFFHPAQHCLGAPLYCELLSSLCHFYELSGSFIALFFTTVALEFVLKADRTGPCSKKWERAAHLPGAFCPHPSLHQQLPTLQILTKMSPPQRSDPAPAYVKTPPSFPTIVPYFHM